MSILDANHGNIEITGSKCDLTMGGDDFRQLIIDYMADEFKKHEGIDLRNDSMAIGRLKEAAEKAKTELLTSMEADLNLSFLSSDQSGPKHLNLKITRLKFELLAAELIKHIKGLCIQVLSQAKLKPQEINEVILVGSDTLIPCVQEMVKQVFKKDGKCSVDPNEVIAIGAAIKGAHLETIHITYPIAIDYGDCRTLIDSGAEFPIHCKGTFNSPTGKLRVLRGHLENDATNQVIGTIQLDRDDQEKSRGFISRMVPWIRPRWENPNRTIEVTIDVKDNGLLDVSVFDTRTGKNISDQFSLL